MKYLLIFLASNMFFGFLNAQNIDTLQPDPSAGKDAMISNYYQYVNLNIGNYPYFIDNASNSGGNFLYRSLIDFDLANIPANAIINNATLSLYFPPNYDNFIQYSSSTVTNESYLRRITSSWVESTVTWNNQPTTTTFNQVTIPPTTSTTEDKPNINITALVQDYVNNKTTSFGFELLLATEYYYRMMVFGSSDYSVPSKRPRLIVSWTNPLTTTMSKNDITCNGLCNGKAYVTASSNGIPNTYLWSQGGLTDTISNLCAGTYTVTVTSGTTIKVDSITINQPAPLMVNGFSDTTICPGQTANLLAIGSGGTAPILYYWSNNIGFGASKIVNPTTTTKYYVNALDILGCTSTFDSVLVSISTLPTLTLTGLLTDYCFNSLPSTISVTPLGGTITGNGILGNQFNPQLSGIGSHSIVYNYTNQDGCTSSLSKPVNVHNLPTATFSAILPPFCQNSANTVLVGIPSGGTFLGAGINNGVFSPQSAGIGKHLLNYFYTDSFGCSDQDTQTVTVNNIPFLNLGPDTSIYTNQNLYLDAGYGFSSYLWQDSSTNQYYSIFGSTAGLGKHQYYAIITNASGCQNSDTIYVSIESGIGMAEAGEFSFSIVPNPAQDRLYIVFDEQSNALKTLNIYTISGNKVLTINNIRSEEIIDISKLGQGVYLLEVITNNGGLTKKMFIKN